MNGIRTLSLFFALGGAGLHPQKTPYILHEALDCVAKGEYPVIDAVIQPGSDVRAAKVYFRSDKYPKFYFVEMTLEKSTFRSVLPKPSPETEQIIYYIEAVDLAFNNSIGKEHIAEVNEECDRREPKGALLGDEPGIIVGATEAGAPALPPGFEAVGIIGTVTSAGMLSGLGGGPGIGTAVAIGGAAAGAGGFVAAQSSPSPTTTTIVNAATPGTTTSSANPTTVPATTTTTPGATTTTPPTTTAPSTTTTAATTTTTVPPSTTTTTSTPLAACFTVSDGDGGAGCKVDFDASCSRGDIINYAWRFQDNPPATKSSPSATASYDWTSDPACGGPFSRLVRLTVTSSDNRTAETQANINPNSPGLMAAIRIPEKRLATSFTSFLGLPPATGRIEAHVVLNETRIDVTDNSTPHTHRMNGTRGRNTIEGYLSSPSNRAVLWRFGFAASEHFEPGSIHVETGLVVSQDAYSVVLRLSGAPGERVKFSYRLSPE